VIGRRQTLALGSGTRRDFAVLMMEALRASPLVLSAAICTTTPRAEDLLTRLR
jgi:hypothetical protein